jgi:hypothetical protein
MSSLLALDGPHAVAAAALTQEVQNEAQLSQLRDRFSEQAFLSTWTAAQAVLVAGPIDACPVCGTAWPQTQAGSQEKALDNISAGLERVGALRQLEATLAETRSEAARSLGEITSGLRSLEGLARRLKLGAVAAQLEAVGNAFPPVVDTARPASEREVIYSDAAGRLKTYLRDVAAPGIERVSLPGEPEEVTTLDGMIQRFVGLADSLGRVAALIHLAAEYERVRSSFSAIVDSIQKEVAVLVSSAVSRIEADVYRIYRKIHPEAGIAAIRIAADTPNRTLSLRVDFHTEGRTVPPAGYLSESQVNTLGLALFLSAVRLLNTRFPFVFLDDIVSSFDAEHRSRIATVLAEDMAGFQILLTTHDRMFYHQLRARLESAGWAFETVQGWTLEEGPRRRADLPTVREIEEMFKAQDRPQEAGNAVRRFMEEWLDGMCAKFDAYTPHRREDKEFERTLFDFWEPFLQRVGKLQAAFKEHVLGSDAHERLKGHALINFYSHFRPDPYTWAAMGDVTSVWEALRKFQKLFNCRSCGGALRYDKQSGKVYCGCGKGFLP